MRTGARGGGAPLHLPNLYIVGPPRSGTTSLQRWLAAHPDVGRSELKEPLYHAADLATPHRIADRAEYLALFAALDANRYRVDATPWYLYSREAAASIRTMAPDAHIVVMLRDPAEMLASLHSRHVLVGLESEQDFARAVFTGPAREDPSEFRRSLDYLAVGRIGQQVSRYVAQFPSEQVHFVEVAAMASRPESVHLELLGALGLDPIPLDTYEALNEGRVVRNRAVAWVSATVAGRRRSNRVRRGVAWRMARMASTPGREALSTDVRRRVKAALAGDIRELEEITGRDLSAWLE